MTPLISVIVPVYNADAFLEKCVSALLANTFSNFEVLLIDDGSTDQSASICQKYASADARVCYFHQSNQGPSAARNAGIAFSKGKYLAFVDADDSVSPHYLQVLVNPMERNASVDLVSGGFKEYSRVHPNGIALHHVPADMQDRIAYTESFLPYLFQGVAGVLWGKLLRRDIVAHNGLVLNEKLRLSEDLVFLFEYLRFSKHCYFSSEIIYDYNRLHEIGLSGRLSLRNLDDLYEMNQQLRTLAAGFPNFNSGRILEDRTQKMLWKILNDVMVTQPVTQARKSVKTLLERHPEILNRNASGAIQRLQINLLRRSMWTSSVFAAKLTEAARQLKTR